MTQHQTLTLERWTRFALDQQLLMIANEMNRASRLFDERDHASRQLAYERVLRLVDLTVQATNRHSLRKELLRWRGLIGKAYVDRTFDLAAHLAALRVLLLTSPIAAKQIPYVLAEPGPQPSLLLPKPLPLPTTPSNQE